MINILIMCEDNDRFVRCGNWSLDLKNKRLTENNVLDDIEASAVVTGSIKSSKNLIF